MARRSLLSCDLCGNRRSIEGREGFELRVRKSVLLVFTVQAGYSGRQSALPRFANLPWEKPCRFFRRGFDQIATIVIYAGTGCGGWSRTNLRRLRNPVSKRTRSQHCIGGIPLPLPSSNSFDAVGKPSCPKARIDVPISRPRRHRALASAARLLDSSLRTTTDHLPFLNRHNGRVRSPPKTVLVIVFAAIL